MARIADRVVFLKRLVELSGEDGNFVPNEKLLQKLRWEKEKYHAIYGLLKQEGLIVVKRGRGGLVAPADNQQAEKLKVFISYSHADKELQEKLSKHLRPLEREGLINVWADQQIKAGDDWDKEISKKLDGSDIVLALVSIDFINSSYCYDTELEKALVRESEGQARVIPVILRNCLWNKSPLGRLKALPTDGKAVTSWSDIDEALTVIAMGVRDSANSLLDSR